MLHKEDFDNDKIREAAVPLVVQTLEPLILTLEEAHRQDARLWLTEMLGRDTRLRAFRSGENTVYYDEHRLYSAISEDLRTCKWACRWQYPRLRPYVQIGQLAIFFLSSVSPLPTREEQELTARFKIEKEINQFPIDAEVMTQWMAAILIGVQPLMPAMDQNALRELFQSSQPEDFDLLRQLGKYSIKRLCNGYGFSMFYRQCILQIISEQMAAHPVAMDYQPTLEALNVALGRISCSYFKGDKLEDVPRKRSNLKLYIKELLPICELVKSQMYPNMKHDADLILDTCILTDESSYRDHAQALLLLDFIQREYDYNLPNARLYKLIKPEKTARQKAPKPQPEYVLSLDEIITYANEEADGNVGAIRAMLRYFYTEKEGWEKKEVLKKIKSIGNPEATTVINGDMVHEKHVQTQIGQTT